MSIIEKALRSGEKAPRRPEHAPAPDEHVDLKPAEDRPGVELAKPAESSAGLMETAIARELALAEHGSNEFTPDDRHASTDAIEPEKPESGTFGDDQFLAGERGCRPVLQLPFVALHEAGFLTPSVPRSRIAEEFRGIKRPILKNIVSKAGSAAEHSNLIMVTSALQGDGKTFSSINLALSIAMEQDKTVLFVDADVVRATAGKTLGVPRGTPGLIDLLGRQDGLKTADVIYQTSVENLRVLPAGNVSDKSTELLASGAMQELMVELSTRYADRVIVFDSPPLLLTTEASVLASFMGQIVFVASADVTPQHAIQEALEFLGEDKMVGVMLNRASRRRSLLLGIGSYGYGYGYSYGYGYGYGAEREKPKKKKGS